MAILAKKESRGRQKIKMAKIKNSNHLQVTFSKCRVGLFKKASEICTLCGVEAFIIIFSPGQKLFSFGYPDVESLVDRFLTRTTSSSQLSCKNPTKPESVPQNSTLCELNSQLTRITDLLEIEKNRGEMFDNMRKSSQWWWEAPIDELGLHELELLSASLEDLKNNVATHAMFLEESNSSSSILSMDNNGVEVSEHLNLKPIEAKIEGFCFPYQVDNSYAPMFY
ncbi:agamous-like MADS-box protein AGL61 [Silene latifolia]|uniref:agamous-like MADS-box protein AGL61 n=1 Tax=Silene latifolia TaxID=37657 RepID=UPI003D77B4D2